MSVIKEKYSYLLLGAGVLVGSLFSVRVGALIIALALATYSIPRFATNRPLERVIPIALILSLVLIALALPRR